MKKILNIIKINFLARKINELFTKYQNKSNFIFLSVNDTSIIANLSHISVVMEITVGLVKMMSFFI